MIRPSSRCPACDTPIRPWDNIPIFSYLWLRGRCRACRVRISPRYLAVEILTGVLCLALLHRYGVSWSFLAYFILVAALLVATFVDLAHLIIPNEVTYLLVAVGLGLSLIPGATVRPWEALIGASVGAGVLLAVALAYRFWRGVHGLGGGDVKLLAGIGAFLGWRGLPLVLFLGAGQGLVAAGIWILARRGRSPVPPPPPPEGVDDEEEPGPPPGRLAVPFGPFLALATLEVLFFGRPLSRLIFGVDI